MPWCERAQRGRARAQRASETRESSIRVVRRHRGVMSSCCGSMIDARSTRGVLWSEVSRHETRFPMAVA